MNENKRSKTNYRSLGIIPARYGSLRLPGKPLLTIGEKSIIQHVYERASEALPQVLVATDDVRIVEEVESFGGEVILTSTEHRSGTDRIREALDKSGHECDIVINIQGDEPFVSSPLLHGLVEAFMDPCTQIATPITPYAKDTPIEVLGSPHDVKVVRDTAGYALYFSRFPIPYLRSSDGQSPQYYKHVGIYAFRTEVLREVTNLPVSPLEQAEGLEQLRWLEAGYRIKTLITEEESIGIDTEEDLERARNYFAKLHLK